MSHYLTNKLIGYRPLSDRQARRSPSYDFTPCEAKHHPVLIRLSTGYPGVRGTLPVLYSPFRHSFTQPCGRINSFDLHVSTTPPAFALSQDQTLQLESVDHKTRLIAGGESVPVSFNTPLGRAGRFRPTPPDLPTQEPPRRAAPMRDTLPPCLGSNCSLDKDRAGLTALSRHGILTPQEGGVNAVLSVFFTFSGPWWHEQRPRSKDLHLRLVR